MKLHRTQLLILLLKLARQILKLAVKHLRHLQKNLQPNHGIANRKDLFIYAGNLAMAKTLVFNIQIQIPALYTVVHHYQQPGVYEVCVRIVYEGGCEATKCKSVYVTIPDECRADFEKLALTPTISPLHVTFKALPWHNNNKKPKKICWIFGDGRDTCIEYSTTYTGSYLITHKYNHPGTYEVCVKILYDGGCEASKCKPFQINEPDRCGADFERIPATSTNDLLVVGFNGDPIS